MVLTVFECLAEGLPGSVAVSPEVALELPGESTLLALPPLGCRCWVDWIFLVISSQLHGKMEPCIYFIFYLIIFICAKWKKFLESTSINLMAFLHDLQNCLFYHSRQVTMTSSWYLKSIWYFIFLFIGPYYTNNRTPRWVSYEGDLPPGIGAQTRPLWTF